MCSNWCFKESELLHTVDFYFVHRIELSPEQINQCHKLSLDCSNIILYLLRDQSNYLGCQLFCKLKSIVYSGVSTPILNSLT
jgi:hypothetical protein